MSERTYIAGGIITGALVGVLALIGLSLSSVFEMWWILPAIGGIVSGLWWTVGSMYMDEEEESTDSSS